MTDDHNIYIHLEIYDPDVRISKSYILYIKCEVTWGWDQSRRLAGRSGMHCRRRPKRVPNLGSQKNPRHLRFTVSANTDPFFLNMIPLKGGVIFFHDFQTWILVFFRFHPSIDGWFERDRMITMTERKRNHNVWASGKSQNALRGRCFAQKLRQLWQETKCMYRSS